MDQNRLHELFVQEFHELVAALNDGLLALEQTAEGGPRQEIINDLFRSAHTLKGAAQSAGERAVAARCHELEERFDSLRRDPVAVDAETIASLYTLVDAIGSQAEPSAPTAIPAPTPQATPTPQPASPTAPSAASPPRPPRQSGGETMRLQATKLDVLLEQAGELLLSEQALSELLADEVAVDPQRVRRGSRRLRQAGTVLEDIIRTLRMAPFGEACDGLARLARDVAAQTGKSVRLEVAGAAVELDRPVLEALREPLAHLVRNAVDHGIETPERRRAAGKREQGRVTVRAELRGGRVLVRVEDDGAGIDVDAVRSAAQARGVEASERELGSLVFSPGFSTATKVTETSGRGVGLDAVRAAVESLGGDVGLDTQPGGGLAVDLLLPLTLSALRVVLVESAGCAFALASSAIERLLMVEPAQVRTVEGRDRLVTADGPVPLVPLAGVLGLATPGEVRERFPVVLAATAGQQVALMVDSLGRELEITVRGMGERIAGVPTALGGALLPDGRPVVVLSPAACARLGLEGPPSPLARPSPDQQRRIRVLLAEDSLTTRTLERAILEAAGYEVVAAADGLEAWGLLGREHVDIVVSDVSMPRMTGFGLCEQIRASSRRADLPVILVTSRSSDEDRLRGLQAGASAYLTKQAFDQGNLLDTIEQLVGVTWPSRRAS